MYTLQNEFLLLTVDESARLTVLQNLKTGRGNVIAHPAPLWRAVLHTGKNMEDVAFAQDASMSFETGPDALTIHVNSLHTPMGEKDVQITLTISLEGETVKFGAKIENRSESTVSDFLYPCLGGIETLGHGRPGLLYPQHYGEYHTDIGAELADKQTRYGERELVLAYPHPLSMQWMTLMDGDQCLYLAGHDSLFHASFLRALGSDARDVRLEMNKLAFVKPGETWSCPEYVMWLYQGGWQQGANEYRQWANSWRKPISPEPWMKDMNGYLLVINRQQYGDTLWDYSTLPHLYDIANEHGFDTVGLFGWFDSGHDNMYPDLEASPSMGGAQLLKDGIQAIQDKGGRVTLYYQGHLIDMDTDFYQHGGSKMEGKSIWGRPYYEEYSKYCNSDFLRSFTRKMFVTVCPWCEDWHRLMAERADWVRSFGADAILYDQIGGIHPTPCFDESHGHTKPSLSYTQGRLKLLPAIRQSVDKHPGYAFMSENMTDVYSQFMDCIHGIGSHVGAHAERAAFVSHGGVRVIHMPEMFRHCFPETISTVRNGHPYINPRMVNYALCYGFRFEMELRYLKDKASILSDGYPEWKTYARQASALRRKYADLLLHGDYACDIALQKANPALHHGVFTNGDKQCIVFWNDSDAALPLDLAGHKASRWATATSEGDGVPHEIAAGEAVVVFA